MLNERGLCGKLIVVHADGVHRVLYVFREVVIWRVHRYVMMLTTSYGHHLRCCTAIEGAKEGVLGHLVSTISHGELRVED